MNQVESAVSGVAVGGAPKRARAVKAADVADALTSSLSKASMIALQLAASASSAINVEAKRGRGRQPVFLKGGKPLKEARDEAKAGVATAKAALKDAKAIKATALKADKDAKRGALSAQNELGRVTGKPLPNKQEQKDALTNAKAAVKSADTAAKATGKAVSDADKAIVKATAAVTKAEEARLKVETAHVAAKAPSQPTVN